MKSRSKLYARKEIALDENGGGNPARQMSFAYYLTESDIAGEAELFCGVAERPDDPAGGDSARGGRASEARESGGPESEARANESMAREDSERAFALSSSGRSSGGSAARSGVCYGVRITLRESGKTEDVRVDGITPDKSAALRLAGLLAENLATPLSLRDILDDLLGALE
ncbi:MAG: DUF6514 family protein [Clostridiales bacterium]|jgi:hypothetical protein|nr:DUF6514 family protein [Clostridiales bacterium]